MSHNSKINISQFSLIYFPCYISQTYPLALSYSQLLTHNEASHESVQILRHFCESLYCSRSTWLYLLVVLVAHILVECSSINGHYQKTALGTSDEHKEIMNWPRIEPRISCTLAGLGWHMGMVQVGKVQPAPIPTKPVPTL